MYEKELKMAVSIMTMIDFFKAVASNEITDEVIAKANELIAKDAADKEKAKAKRAEKAKATDANVGITLGLLTSEPQTCPELVAKLVEAGAKRAEDKEITPQYVAKLVGTLVDDGKAVRLDIKGGKGKVKAYTLA